MSENMTYFKSEEFAGFAQKKYIYIKRNTAYICGIFHQSGNGIEENV